MQRALNDLVNHHIFHLENLIVYTYGAKENEIKHVKLVQQPKLAAYEGVCVQQIFDYQFH